MISNEVVARTKEQGCGWDGGRRWLSDREESGSKEPVRGIGIGTVDIGGGGCMAANRFDRVTVGMGYEAFWEIGEESGQWAKRFLDCRVEKKGEEKRETLREAKAKCDKCGEIGKLEIENQKEIIKK